MHSDIIKITIKVKDDDLDLEEVAGEIKVCLLNIIETLEKTGGDVQQLKSSDDVVTMEYVHLRETT